MFKNKSPYSHVPNTQNKQLLANEAPPSPLSKFAQAINTKQQKKKQFPQEHNYHQIPTLANKRSNNSKADIDLECHQVLVSPTFQQDLKCDQQITFQTKNNASSYQQSAHHKNSQTHTKPRQFRELKNKQEQNRCSPGLIDFQCKQNLVSGSSQESQALKLFELYQRFQSVLSGYKKELQKKQERINYLESKQRKVGNLV